MKSKMIDILKMSLKEENPNVIFKLINENTKKAKEHNELMLYYLSLCDDESITCTSKTNKYTELTIGKAYIEKIINKLS